MKKIFKTADKLTFTEKLAISKGLAEYGTLDENGIFKAVDAPADMRIGGTLIPEEVESLMPRVTDRSKFLKMITTLNISGMTANLNDYVPTEDGTRRPLAFGSLASSSDTTIDNPGNTVTMYELQELYLLKDTVLQSMLSQPNFENAIMDNLNIQWSNNLAKLAASGTAFTAGSFAAMLKGFIQLLVDAVATVNNVVYATYSDPIDLLVAMETTMPEKYADNPDLTFFVTKADHDKLWAKLQSGITTGLAYVPNEGIVFKGKKVEWIPYLTASNAFYTSAKNLVICFNKDGMKLERERSAEHAGDKIIMNYQAAFGVMNYDGVVHAS